MRGFRVAGVTWPILVASVDGELIATASVCPHEDVSLLDGSLDAGHITCPGHAYEFELRTGRCVHDARLVLRRYKLTVVGSDVYVDLI
jgi:nitrite reductase/ring-hydroxylating ferredoxin subunit